MRAKIEEVHPIHLLTFICLVFLNYINEKQVIPPLCSSSALTGYGGLAPKRLEKFKRNQDG